MTGWGQLGERAAGWEREGNGETSWKEGLGEPAARERAWRERAVERERERRRPGPRMAGLNGRCTAGKREGGPSNLSRVGITEQVDPAHVVSVCAKSDLKVGPSRLLMCGLRVSGVPLMLIAAGSGVGAGQRWRQLSTLTLTSVGVLCMTRPSSKDLP